jgi:energy-coupling factor transporter ATP-binding protein EcfA2
MWLKSVQLKNIRGFVDSGSIEFSKSLNVLVGSNNSGKSTILRSVALLQPPEVDSGDYLKKFYPKYIRLEASECEVSVEVADPDPSQWKGNQNHFSAFRNHIKLRHVIRSAGGNVIPDLPASTPQLQHFTIPCFNAREPNNFIYPYFSRRKPQQLMEGVGLHTAQVVEETFASLYAKIDRLTGQDIPQSATFRNVCRDVLGFTVSCFPSQGGKQAGLVVRDGVNIPMDNMGEGIINIVGLLVHLALYDGKLYLIEEIENDIHPKALKKLLDFGAFFNQ